MNSRKRKEKKKSLFTWNPVFKQHWNFFSISLCIWVTEILVYKRHPESHWLINVTFYFLWLTSTVTKQQLQQFFNRFIIMIHSIHIMNIIVIICFCNVDPYDYLLLLSSFHILNTSSLIDRKGIRCLYLRTSLVPTFWNLGALIVI